MSVNWDDWGNPVRRPEVWLRSAGDENALYDPDSASVHLLNETALAIWDLCDGDTKPAEMIDAICELCGAHPDVVSEDVERILMELNAAHLIHWNLAPKREPAGPAPDAP